MESPRVSTVTLKVAASKGSDHTAIRGPRGPSVRHRRLYVGIARGAADMTSAIANVSWIFRHSSPNTTSTSQNGHTHPKRQRGLPRLARGLGAPLALAPWVSIPPTELAGYFLGLSSTPVAFGEEHLQERRVAACVRQDSVGSVIRKECAGLVQLRHRDAARPIRHDEQDVPIYIIATI
jgi:hypothetical protein